VISRPITSPVEAYAAGVRGWACEVPIVNVHVVSDSSGLSSARWRPYRRLPSNGSRFQMRTGSDVRCATSVTYSIKNSSALRSANTRAH